MFALRNIPRISPAAEGLDEVPTTGGISPTYDGVGAALDQINTAKTLDTADDDGLGCGKSSIRLNYYR